MMLAGPRIWRPQLGQVDRKRVHAAMDAPEIGHLQVMVHQVEHLEVMIPGVALWLWILWRTAGCRPLEGLTLRDCLLRCRLLESRRLADRSLLRCRLLKVSPSLTAHFAAGFLKVAPLTTEASFAASFAAGFLKIAALTFVAAGCFMSLDAIIAVQMNSTRCQACTQQPTNQNGYGISLLSLSSSP